MKFPVIRTVKGARGLKRQALALGAGSLLLALGWMPPPAAAENRLVQVRPMVDVKGAEILMAELAQDPDSLPVGWGQRAVIKAPGLNKSQQMPLMDIAYALQQYPDMSEVVLRGTTLITVQRQATPLSSAAIVQAIEEYVKATPPWREARVQIECRNVSGDFQLPLGKREVQVVDFKETDARGTDFLCHIELRVNGGLEKTLKVPVHLTTLEEVWVAARSLKPGQPLAPEDAKPAWMPTDKNSRLIPVRETIAGQEVDRNIHPDQPLLRHNLQEPLCAERGEMIQVVAKNKNLQITLRARALHTGRRGEKITCLNEQSKRQMVVRMTGIRSAEMEF